MGGHKRMHKHKFTHSCAYASCQHMHMRKHKCRHTHAHALRHHMGIGHGGWMYTVTTSVFNI